MTAEAAQFPLVASVLSLRMRGTGGDPGLQAGRREQLVATARKALAGWSEDRRVVLEAPDGLAFVGDVPPSVALQAASLLARDESEASIGIGLHHGSVQVVEEGGSARIRGEALDTASALAGVTATHPIVASQSFRDRVAAWAPREVEDLRPAGEMIDEQLRKHPIFVFDAGAARGRSLRRNVLATSGIVLLVGAGFAGRLARQRYEAARRPALIHLDIKPAGEIFIDGQLHGTTPPMLDLSLPPGPHSIEVRSGRFPPLRLDVQLQPGEELQLKHSFAAPVAPQRRARPKDKEPGSLVDQLKESWKKIW